MVFHKRKSHFFATKTQNRSGACFPDRSLMTGGIRCSRYPGIAGCSFRGGFIGMTLLACCAH